MIKYIIFVVIMLSSMSVMAGPDIEFKIKMRIGADGFKKPTMRIGKSDVQYIINYGRNHYLELGKFRWNYKSPRELVHEYNYDYLDLSLKHPYNVLND